MRGCLKKAKTKRVLPKGQHTWRIILSLGRGADGRYKQNWSTFHGTRQQAETRLIELTGEFYRGEFVESSKVTIGAWLDDWMEKAIQPPRCSPNTYKTYRHAIEKHLRPGLGHIALQQLTPLHVERYYAERRATLRRQRDISSR